ncbi:orotidine-5'-phosphate decarboxylase [Methanobrevibacter woesei]|uniref:orotidine-5'-phosphate decarboxylase n=1 Tax=Methanobrevibacter woesei TaxID=190976 RepID=UPI0023F01444|nr:orotidine-5'-phosphate decarboxylase [Methanobrevibacter woesei]
MKVKNNIILALDVMNMKEATEICEKLEKNLDTIKIGYPLTLAEGLEAVSEIKETFNFKVICDYKVADIPATNSKICNQTFKAGADAIICHGFVGQDSVQVCADEAGEFNAEVFLLTEMSHPGAKLFLQDNADAIAKMGVDMGIKNYVAPATRINRLKEIREIVGKDAFIISPGVGKQGGDVKETLNYANAAIIGRSIYESDDPQKALKDFINLI